MKSKWTHSSSTVHLSLFDVPSPISVYPFSLLSYISCGTIFVIIFNLFWCRWTLIEKSHLCGTTRVLDNRWMLTDKSHQCGPTKVLDIIFIVVIHISYMTDTHSRIYKFAYLKSIIIIIMLIFILITLRWHIVTPINSFTRSLVRNITWFFSSLPQNSLLMLHLVSHCW